MIARRPSGGDVRGATPAHPLLFPVGHQDASLSQSPQQQLLDQRYIQRMFADGALGGLWLPEPQYLSEDSKGTMSASLNGVVGAWRRVGDAPPVYTPVTIANADFELGDTGWTKGADWSIGSGVATKTAGTASVLSQAVSLIAGAAYVLTWTMTRTVGTLTPRFSGGTTNTGTGMALSGTYEENFVATTGNNTLDFSADASFAGTIDNVSLAAVAPAPALQATTANKPYLRRTPVSGKYWLDGNTATAAMTATFPSSLGSACTVARANADGVTITPAQTITTTYNLTPPFSYNSAVMVINRALTASETAVVSRYLRNWVPVLGAELITNGNFDTGIGEWTAFNVTLSYENSGLTMTKTGEYGSSFSPHFYCGDSHCFVKATFTYDATSGSNFIYVNDRVGSATKMNVNMLSTLGTYTGVTTKLLPTGAVFVFSFSSSALIGDAASIDSVSARSIL